MDYPIYNEVPSGLQFTCDNRIPGYYADPEARCQVRIQITLIVKLFVMEFNKHYNLIILCCVIMHLKS